MTAAKVVDASALSAVLFREPAAEAVAARMRGGVLVAPTLLGYEIASVCLKKILTYPALRTAVLRQFSVWDQMGIELVEIDHYGVPPLAEQFGLTSYDASYLWLAQKLDAELITLDRRLLKAHQRQRSSVI